MCEGRKQFKFYEKKNKIVSLHKKLHLYIGCFRSWDGAKSPWCVCADIFFFLWKFPQVCEAENEKPQCRYRQPHFLKSEENAEKEEDMHAPVWLHLDSEILWSLLSHEIVE